MVRGLRSRFITPDFATERRSKLGRAAVFGLIDIFPKHSNVTPVFSSF